MKSLAFAITLALITLACGTSSAPNKDDLAALAGAIREIQARGAHVSLDEQVVQSGGSIPQGQEGRAELKAEGTFKADRAAVRLRLTGNSRFDYDLVIDDADVYVRPHGVDRAYFLGAAAAAETFYEGLRLNLLRDIALLAAKESFNAYNVKEGELLRRYVVTPGSDQVEQLQSAVDFTSAESETSFLKSASGSITFYLTFSGNHLHRYEIHLVGTDPASGIHSDIRSTVVVSSIGKASAITVPDNWISVSPDQLFATGH